VNISGSCNQIMIIIGTGGRITWNHWTVELVHEIGSQATLMTGEPRESTFLFQQLSIALQSGNAVAFLNTFDTVAVIPCLLQCLKPVALCWWLKNNKLWSVINFCHMPNVKLYSADFICSVIGGFIEFGDTIDDFSAKIDVKCSL